MKIPNEITGLSTEQVITSRNKYGSNDIDMAEDRVLLHVLKEVVMEPMFILLLCTCFIYFFAGAHQEGFIMVIAVFIVAGISLLQEYRSRNAIQALKRSAASKATVFRNAGLIEISAGEVVVDDIMIIEEGQLPAADGVIVSSNDLSLNESILNGESVPLYKTASETIYKGTLVTSGSAFIKVTAVGNNTMFGKIGLSLKEVTVLKTPLQIQVSSFVKYMVWIGLGAFVFVVAYNYYHSGNFTQAFLQGLTLAMSILPEEIPVAFSTFQALGAFRLLRNNIIVKQPQYVETLGSATVICADKTGTITQNRMSIKYIYDAATGTSVQYDELINNKPVSAGLSTLIEYAMWASETNPFDPMEKAIHTLYEKTAANDKRLLHTQVHEYPVGGKPPMMTHIYKSNERETIIAAKGAPEAILRLSNLQPAALKNMEAQAIVYARQGYRVLAAGKGKWGEKTWPVSQQEFSFDFLGLIVFQDPPKENIKEVIKQFYSAGIKFKLITGDYAETAVAIAAQAGVQNNEQVLLGDEILHLSNEALQQKVKQVNIYARMFPEAKMKVINALKENGEIVAMTGDGVNDAPALKAAHIGIAMGKRGSEVAKSAASLILADDDLAHMVTAVAQGRKIYGNLKKAIQYIVSIHIPIILIVMIPLAFNWKFSSIFSPVHVIFLELIMGPTCSIIYENEPMEPGTMLRPPGKMGNSFLSFRRLMFSIIQGLIITTACLGAGYYFIQQQFNEAQVRTIVFITLLFSNIFLTLVNRSFKYTVFTTIRYKNNLVPAIILVTLFFIGGLLFVPWLQQLFKLQALPVTVVGTCAITALCGTLWVDVWKKIKPQI